MLVIEGGLMRPFIQIFIFPHRHRQHDHKTTKKKRKRPQDHQKSHQNTPSAHSLTKTNDYAKQTKHAENEPNAVKYIIFIYYFIFVINNEKCSYFRVLFNCF